MSKKEKEKKKDLFSSASAAVFCRTSSRHLSVLLHIEVKFLLCNYNYSYNEALQQIPARDAARGGTSTAGNMVQC